LTISSGKIDDNSKVLISTDHCLLEGRR